MVFLALRSQGVYGELVKFLAPFVQTMGFPVFKQKTDPARTGPVRFQPVSGAFGSKFLKVQNIGLVSLNRAVNTATYWWGFSGLIVTPPRIGGV